MTKQERCEAASVISRALLPNYGTHFLLDGDKLSIQYHTTSGKRKHPVRVVGGLEGSYTTFFKIHPWGMNSEEALVRLAQWIRTGKMPLTLDQWQRWCGPPVMLGNPEFLEALREHVYGGAATRAEVMAVLGEGAHS